MSKIDELIQELCPNGVKFLKLEEAASIKRGKRVTKNELSADGAYPVYSGGVTPMGYYGKSNQPSNKITVVKYGTAGFVNFITEDFWANDVCYCIKPIEELNNKYLFYVLKDKQGLIQSQATDAIPAHLPTEVIGSVQVPVPPIEVQKEIVDILDKFTRLEAELSAELEARRKQYGYYRNQLFMFDELQVRWLELGEVCKVSRGRVMSKDYLTDNAGDFPVYSSQTANNGIFGRINSYDYDFESITWTTDGANAGSVFYHNNEKFSITNVCGLLQVKSESLSSRFLYYALQMLTKPHVSAGMGNPKLMSNVMSKIKVPVPPLEEQNRIVNILDNFDLMVNGISEGLPAEMKARRKQYEYYRTKLLTFQGLPA